MYCDAKCINLRQSAVASKDRLTISLDLAEYRELQELAKEHNVSMAWLGRQAIARLLAQYRQREFQFPLELRRWTETHG